MQDAYAIDWNGPLPDEVLGTTSVPETLCPLCDRDLHHLTTTIDPLSQSDSNGLDLFCRCKSFVQRHLQL